MRRIAGDLPAGEGKLRFRPTSAQDVYDIMDEYGVPEDYWALYEVPEGGPEAEGTLPSEEVDDVRDWDQLSARTKHRYLASNRLQRLARERYGRRGSRADVIRRWYNSGGDLRAARGHQTPESFGRLRQQVSTRGVARTSQLELWVDRGRNRGRGRPHR